MVHSSPPVTLQKSSLKRFRLLLDGSVRAFGKYGFQRCQIADIAQEAGVALGTIYRYAESKVALFDAAVRHGLGDSAASEPKRLPLANPEPGATLAFLRKALIEFYDRLAADREAAASGQHPIEEELRLIIGSLYDALAQNRGGIRIVDRSAREWPELAELFFSQVRGPGIAAFEGYLKDRIAAGLLLPVPDVPTAARQILEMCAWMGIHRKWTPDERCISDEAARESVLCFSLRTLLAKPGDSL